MDNLKQQLFDAARTGDITRLRDLIAQDADVNVQDAKGYTPLIIASYNNQPEAVKALIEAGADVDLPDCGGNTALMGVCFKGYPGIAEFLTN